ncbi:MAG TPA: regulatory iron-sulfur-containing complex subunit RicT [Atribacterota bacterium]|nr:regulatory iron-sulfur-containing complex subunit RicT [Atribacterota bacterium]
MPKVTGLKFNKTNYIYYFKVDSKIQLKKGDVCLVKTSIGLDLGTVVIPFKFIKTNEIDTPLKNILRKANKEDFKKLEIIRQEEDDALNICKEKIKKYNLPMKLVYVKYLFDKSRIIFYFISAQRIDFRELVKDLVKLFKTKVELRQIGIRDGTKMIGGIGICGREVCCASFIQKFTPIHINMAKIQKIAMNQSKVSGLCGRLMCCLSYESEFYKECLKKYPRLKENIETEKGKGKVIEVNVLKKYVIAELETDGGIMKKIKIPEEEFEKLGIKNISTKNNDDK